MAHRHDPLGRALLGTLDVLPIGIVVMAGQRVLAANAEALRISSGEVLRLGRGTLSFESHAANQAFQRAWRGDGAMVFRVPHPGRGRDYECRVVRLAATEVAVVFIADPDHLPLDGDALRELHGLTRGEMRVVERLAAGATPDSVAEELCVSAHTVRAHLRSVFAKTRTRGQAELIRVLSCGVARMRCLELPRMNDAE